MANETFTFIVTVLYPKKDMTGFDMDYYLKNHIPSAKTKLGPVGMMSCTPGGIEGEGEPEYAVQIITTWKDRASWPTAKELGLVDELGADTPNFTNVIPVFVVGEVLG